MAGKIAGSDFEHQRFVLMARRAQGRANPKGSDLNARSAARRVEGRMPGIIVILFQGVATKMTHMDVGNAGSVWNMNRPCAAKNVQSTS